MLKARVGRLAVLVLMPTLFAACGSNGAGAPTAEGAPAAGPLVEGPRFSCLEVDVSGSALAASRGTYRRGSKDKLNVRVLGTRSEFRLQTLDVQIYRSEDVPDESTIRDGSGNPVRRYRGPSETVTGSQREYAFDFDGNSESGEPLKQGTYLVAVHLRASAPTEVCADGTGNFERTGVIGQFNVV